MGLPSYHKLVFSAAMLYMTEEAFGPGVRINISNIAENKLHRAFFKARKRLKHR